jgi:two-component system sensor histidine kinase CpxA
MFRKILAWFGFMLAFSFAAFLITNVWLSPRARFAGDMMRRLSDFQARDAVRAFETEGKPGLASRLAAFDRAFPANHSLLDGRGVDLLTGKNRQDLLRKDESPRVFWPPLRSPPRARAFPFQANGEKYYFAIEVEPRSEPFGNLATYGWIVLVIVLLCYVLAWRLGIPVRQLREAVTRFGTGDLTVRTLSRRQDELGDLARSFDQMAERIQTLLTAERRLLQDVSHELRSPLARLKVSLELARVSGQPEQSLERVEREVDRLTALVNSLLEVTRAEGDPAARVLEPVELKLLLESIVDGCRIEAEQRDCAIDLFVKQPVVCHGDRELLHRAVENVLRNAIRHSPGQSTVDVDLIPDSSAAVLQIRDYGPGVPEEELARLFEPFYRVETHRSREKGGGVGLGLAIADRAVRVHHGAITARNAYPGLLVELRLPLA